MGAPRLREPSFRLLQAQSASSLYPRVVNREDSPIRAQRHVASSIASIRIRSTQLGATIV
jgi:hypothetical protein